MKTECQTETSTLAALPCDTFERQLVPVLRRLVRTYQKKDTLAFFRTYDRAVQLWGEPIGLSIVHLLQKLILEFTKCRGEPLECFFPSDRTQLDVVSRDEYNLIAMLHHMRRNEIKSACQFADDLANGSASSKALQQSLNFSKRFNGCTKTPTSRSRARVRLKVVEG